MHIQRRHESVAARSRLDDVQPDGDQRARYALAATREGVWDWDMASGTVYFSPQWARLLGYEPHEVPNRVEFFFEVLHPDDLEQVKAVVDAHVSGLTPVKQNEVRLRMKSGAYRWFFDRGEVVSRDTSGRPLRMVGTIRDITARKQLEARQLVQRTVLELIASGAPLAHSLTVLARSLDAVSEATRSSILLLDDDGQHLRTLAAPNLPEPYSRAIDGVRIGPAVGSCGTAAYRGVPIIVEDIDVDPRWEAFRDLARAHGLRACWSTPILDARGQVLGTFAVYAGTPARPSGEQEQLIALATDVAAIAINKHRAERALRESEERNRLLIEASDVGLWDWNLVTDEVYFSPEWKRQLGYEPDEIPHRLDEWSRRLHPEDREATLQASQDFRDGRRRDYDIEFRLRHKDGSWRWLLTRGSISRDAGGRPVRMMGCHVDITARQEAEAARASLELQLVEAHKMQAIGTLAGGIAHDFNNILASILASVTLARQEAGDSQPVLESLEVIQRSSLRARDLVQQILAFSRREPRQLVCQPIRPLVVEAIGLLRSTLPATVAFESRLSDAPMYGRVVASQMQQVIVNICTNAWQAMTGPGGRILVGLEPVVLTPADAQAVGLGSAGPAIHLWVEDSGEGMDAATRARIFEPFFTTKAVGQGTGLGLSVVHGIMTGHGGAISVESEPGRGSVFHLYLPAVPAPAVAAVEPVPGAVARAAAAGQPVLYVDDDEMVVAVVRRLLQRGGYRPTCVTSPVEALALFRSDPSAFDLAIVDYNMPQLSGLDLARAFTRLRPDLPVVVSSGYVSDELRAGAHDAGVRALLEKQNSFDQLVPLVQRLIATG